MIGGNPGVCTQVVWTTLAASYFAIVCTQERRCPAVVEGRCFWKEICLHLYFFLFSFSFVFTFVFAFAFAFVFVFPFIFTFALVLTFVFHKKKYFFVCFFTYRCSPWLSNQIATGYFLPSAHWALVLELEFAVRFQQACQTKENTKIRPLVMVETKNRTTTKPPMIPKVMKLSVQGSLRMKVFSRQE